MKWLENVFRRRVPSKNSAIEKLYRYQKEMDPRTERLIVALPQMAEAARQGGDYLYREVLHDLIRNYDLRFGSDVLSLIDDSKKAALIRKLTSLALAQFFKELAELYPDTAVPSLLTDALHFEIYGALPSQDSFIDYLSYRNANFEDPKAAPAFKFGNDVAEILETLDLSFSFMVSQQYMIVREVSRKLIRFVLFNEPIEADPQSP